MACHIGKLRKVEFLLADRTYSSLSAVAVKQTNRVVGFLFNLLTDWNRLNAGHYVEFQGPKVMAVDFSDEIIPFEASLVCGVYGRIFTDEYAASRRGCERLRVPQRVRFMFQVGERSKACYV